MDGQHELEFYKLGIGGGMVERAGGKQSTTSSQLREIKPDQFEDLRKQWKGSTEIRGPVIIQRKGNDSLPLESLAIAQSIPEMNKRTNINNGPFHDTGRIAFWSSYAKIVAQRPEKFGQLPVEIGGKNIVLDMSQGRIKDYFKHGPLSPDAKLYVGSIKTLVGHTQGTAGLAGLIKTAMCLKHAMIVPNLLFSRLNPEIKPLYGSLEIPTVLREWPQIPDGQPRRASVKSFGFGGTNAHAILESHEQGAVGEKC